MHDFRTGLGGVYADAVFGKASGAAELDVSAEGSCFQQCGHFRDGHLCDCGDGDGERLSWGRADDI